uniref:SURP motif domain-containing protein n=1 Tax=Plectus sambesii TaxID=2011161 RepID=A0A914XR38_9BILA
SNREEDSMNNEPSLSGKQIIGIIYPPPDIRTIVDKTAAFVARNGIDFENKIREKEAGNPRFNFLSQTDPYNAYYQHKVREHQEGKAVEPSIQKPQLPDAIKQHVQQLEFIPRDPPPDFEFSADPATINAFDLDLIKLTALFVARNGRQFLTQLMNREIRNYQFDFLKPQHSNFSYFTKLVEQYTKVIIPPKSLVNDLRLEVENPKKFLDQVKYRVEWERHQRRIKEREEAEAEKERLAYAQIDWHDFVVVQTVDFQPNEISNLPPLCTPKDVGTRILAQARQEAAKAAAQTVEMDMESDSDEEPEKNEMDQEGAASGTQSEMPPENTQQQQKKAAYEVTQPMPAPPQAQNVVIRKDYDPKKARAADISSKKAVDKWIISPLTGERLPADKLAEHMRYNTVDAQEQLERQDEEPVFAPGVDIGRNIEKFAERRTDIFGVGAQGAEQTVIGKKMGEEEIKGPDQKIIWDGHQSSIDATTKAAQQSITIDQQIAEIHKAQGFLPNPDKEKIGPASTTGGGGGPSSSGGPPAAPPAAPPSMPPAMAPRPPQPPMHMLVSQHAAPPVLHVPMQMVGIRPVPVMQQQPR